MEWYDKFKRFLGFPKQQESPSVDDRERYWTPPQPPSRSDELQPPFLDRSFNIFTDPLEIHKYFEQQMSEMLKSFGFAELEDGFSHFSFPQIEDFGDNFSFRYSSPQIEEIPGEDAKPGDLRDQFLKPGYEERHTGSPEEKRDTDVDGKLDIKDWGSVFKGERSVTPYQRHVAPKTRFFGQSVTSKTIRNADGSLETHRTVRDNEGNEETTITRKVGDKEYTVTKRRDKNGKEEIIENLVNLEEKDIDSFFPKRSKNVPDSDPQPWPFFDRFFK